ncbi:MAG: RibD family protein [Proteobacteria bacterium]|nr:RibD family protein [Pseudomonadota bacterium]
MRDDQAIPDHAPDDATWRRLTRRLRDAFDPSPLYDPVVAPPQADDGCFVLGRIAQSLDGRIALPDGRSQWISGPEDILHTHRLRALCDAVVVGSGTVRADDPQLTTRLVAGESPVRVVLDPRRALGETHRVFRDGGATLLACAEAAGLPARHGGAEVLAVPAGANGLDLSALLGALRARGLRRLFVEGGGVTISRFLAAGAFDRLHVTIAPLLLGCGVPAFTLPAADCLSEALRFDWTAHRVGADLLLDVPLSRTCLAAE